MNLNLLRSFAAIYECGTLTGAALQLGLSQPALSHALKQLRATFDDELFVRDGSVFRPTRKASELAPPVLEALSVLSATLEATQRFDPETASDTLRLSVSDYSSRTILPMLTEVIQAQAPGIRLVVSQLSYNSIQDQLQRGEIDLAIMARQSSGHGPNEEILLEERVVCLVRENNPEIGEALDLETFTSVGHVIVNLLGKSRSWVDDKLAAMGTARTVQMVVPYFDALPEIVSRTNLIGSLPARLAQDAARDRSLRVHPLPIDLDPIRFSLRWHPRRRGDPALLWARQKIKETCAVL